MEEDGTITNIDVHRSVSAFRDEEAIRVVKLMPNWSPASGKGVFYASRVLFPITFTLD